MSLEKLNVLESRVRNLVQLVQEVNRENATLKIKLSESQEQLRDQEQHLQDKENEQTGMHDCIERILGELDAVDHGDEAAAAYPRRYKSWKRTTIVDYSHNSWQTAAFIVGERLAYCGIFSIIQAIVGPSNAFISRPSDLLYGISRDSRSSPSIPKVPFITR